MGWGNCPSSGTHRRMLSWFRRLATGSCPGSRVLPWPGDLHSIRLMEEVVSSSPFPEGSARPPGSNPGERGFSSLVFGRNPLFRLPAPVYVQRSGYGLLRL